MDILHGKESEVIVLQPRTISNSILKLESPERMLRELYNSFILDGEEGDLEFLFCDDQEQVESFDGFLEKAADAISGPSALSEISVHTVIMNSASEDNEHWVSLVSAAFDQQNYNESEEMAYDITDDEDSDYRIAFKNMLTENSDYQTIVENDFDFEWAAVKTTIHCVTGEKTTSIDYIGGDGFPSVSEKKSFVNNLHKGKAETFTVNIC